MLWAASAPLNAQNGARWLTVRHVEIEGNRAIDDFALRASIETTASAWLARFPLTRWVGWGRRPAFDETEFRRDVLRLLVLYRQTGYIDARVDTVVARGRDHVDVRFTITEGEPVRVTSLSVSGTEGIIPPAQLIRDLPLREGDPFDQGRLIVSTDSIQRALQNRGFPFPLVYRRFSMQYADKTAQVEFLVDPGPAARIDSIEVIGPPDLDPTRVYETIRLQPGQRFNQSALYQSQQELYRMGVFDFVDVRLSDSLPSGPDDSLVTVMVQVSRGRLHSVRLGGGYGTNDCLRTLASWTARNFLGGGRSLALTAGFSKIGTGAPFTAGFEENICRSLQADSGTERLDLNYNLSAALRFPTVFSPRRSATLTIFGERFSEFQAYIRQAVGFDLSLTQQTKWNIPVTLSYSLSYGSSQADEAVFCSVLNVCREEDTRIFSDTLVKATAGVLLVRDRTNSPINPTRGTVLTLGGLLASHAIGSDPTIQFRQGIAEFRSYHPVGRRGVLAWRVRWGSIRSLEQDIKFVPTEERFYGGGPTTVRGYRQNGLGPLVYVLEIDSLFSDSSGVIVFDRYVDPPPDTLVSPTGGNQMLVGNVEYRFPLSRSGRLGGVLFVDAGRVGGGSDADDPGLRITPGAGVRVFTPLGPLRLDMAYNTYRPETVLLSRTCAFRPEELTCTDLKKVSDNFTLTRTGLLRNFRVNFSIGQAF